MNDSQDERNLLDQLAEDFAERRRRGETPSLSEYVLRHPDLAQDIRDLFPALDVLEQCKPRVGELTAELGAASIPAPSASARLEQLGDYRILREIGRGGMGVVYEAEQVSLGRRVAIKVLPIRPLGDIALSRFQREARAAAGLHHSNIVPVFGVGEDHGMHYYVMQFIVGVGLDQVMEELRRISKGEAFAKAPTLAQQTATAWNRAQFLMSGENAVSDVSAGSGPPASTSDCEMRPAMSSTGTLETSTRNVYFRSVAGIGKQVAEALAYAHSKGILHRDIKPSNLILDDKGTVWVTDFGLAKAVTGDDNLTHAGDIVGTLRFMAPERFQGKSDIRGDLFGLGLTLYEMLTLQPAYHADDRDSLLEQIRTAAPIRPRRVRPEIPRDLETIILKSIDRDPERRYQTGAELAGDLQRFLDDRPILARRTTAVEHLWRWAKRNPAIAMLTSCVATLLCALTLGTTLMSWMLNEERNTAIKNEEHAIKNEDRAIKAEKKIQGERDQAMDNLWGAYLAEIRALRLARQPGFRAEALGVVKKAAAIKTSLALRNQAANLLLSPDVSILHEWENRHGDFTWIGAHPHGHTFVRTNSRGDLSIRTTQDQKEIHRLAGSGPHAVNALFSNSGNFLAVFYDKDNDIRFALWDLRTQSIVWAFKGVKPERWAISADDRWLAVTKGPGEWVLFDIAEKAVVKSIKTTNFPGDLAFDPASKRLAVHSPGSVEIREVPSLAMERRIASLAVMGPLKWHPDGQRLAVCRGQSIALFNLGNPKNTPLILQGHEANIYSCYFSHQGDWLIACSWDGITKFWDLNTGRCEATTPGLVIGIMPDDRHVPFRSGNRLGVWEFHSGLDYRRTLEALIQFEGGISPDERWYAANNGQALLVFDLHTGKLATSHPGVMRGIHFSADGASIFASTAAGVQRLDLQFDGNKLTLSNPVPMLPRPTYHHGGLSARDGKHLAHLGSGEAIVWHDLTTGKDLFTWRDHPRVAGLSLSSDGHWLATGTWQGNGIKIRDTRTGALVQTIPANMTCTPTFSPNGKWLLTAGVDDLRIWDVPSWKLLHTFPRRGIGNWGSHGVFSGDSRYLAIELSPSTIQLVDPTTSAEFLTLDTVASKNYLFLHGLTSNAGTLVGGAPGQWTIVWNLRSVRAHLRTMQLDWDD